MHLPAHTLLYIRLYSFHALLKPLCKLILLHQTSKLVYFECAAPVKYTTSRGNLSPQLFTTGI